MRARFGGRTRFETRTRGVALVLLSLAAASCSGTTREVRDSTRDSTTGQHPPHVNSGDRLHSEDPPAVGVSLPRSIDFVLGNGMRVFLVPSDEVPLVSFRIRVAGGSVEDPVGREGAVSLLADLLSKGAGRRDALAFQEAVEFVGGTFSTSASHRWISLSAEFMADDTDLALELIADALRRPRLDGGEFEKERGLAVDSLKAARDEPNRIIQAYWNAWLFRGHPYARPVSGDERSLAAQSLADVRSAAARILTPARTWMAVAGAFDPADLRRRIEARFGDWSAKGAPALSVPSPPSGVGSNPGQGRVLLVDKPDALQTYFRFGNVGIDWSHPAYPARYLANTVLGGRFTSRLNTALRIEAGLTYGAGSRFDDARGGAFSVRSYTATSTSREALELAAKVYRNLLEGGLTHEELESARTYVQGQYAPDTLETADQAAGMILAVEFDGFLAGPGRTLDRSVVDGFFQALDRLDDLEGFNDRLRREIFPSSPLVWVVIGRAAALRDVVAQFGDVTEVRISAPGFGPTR